MLIPDAWNTFKTTGKVEDYLNYRSQSKDDVESPLYQEGETKFDRADHVNRDSIVGHVDW